MNSNRALLMCILFLSFCLSAGCKCRDPNRLVPLELKADESIRLANVWGATNLVQEILMLPDVKGVKLYYHSDVRLNALTTLQSEAFKNKKEFHSVCLLDGAKLNIDWEIEYMDHAIP